MVLLPGESGDVMVDGDATAWLSGAAGKRGRVGSGWSLETVAVATVLEVFSRV